MSIPDIPYEKYWVHTVDDHMGQVVVYEGIIVQVSESLVRLLGKEWHRVLKELKHHQRHN